MTGMNSLLFLKVLCDLERQKVDTIPDESALDTLEEDTEKSLSFVKIYMQEKFGAGGSLGSKRYACHRCSCLFRCKRHLRLHVRFQCNHKCLGCSECYANIHKSFVSLQEENPKPSKIFSCSLCPTSFQTKGGLAIHKECHPQHGNNTFKCRLCSKEFSKRSELNTHQKRHRTKVPHICKRCGKTFASSSNLARHVRLKHEIDGKQPGHHFLSELSTNSASNVQQNNHSREDQPTTTQEDYDSDEISVGNWREASSKVCGLCQECFKTVPDNRTHVCPKFPPIEDMDKPGGFQCPACSQSYSSFVALKMHCGAHTGSDPFMCTSCERRYSSLRRINYHFEFHGRNTCLKCNLFFQTKLALLLHHCGYSQCCLVCNKVFATESAFKYHQRIHPQPKNFMYKCSECKKSFSKESYFRAHQIDHTGMHPFTCGLCDQKFLMYGQFKKHVSHHLANKKLKCKSCDKVCRTSALLNAHLKTHAKTESLESDCITVNTEHVEVGFQCQICSRVHRKDYQLFIHLRDEHGEAPPYLMHCDLCSRGFYHKLHLNSHKLFCSKRNHDERQQVNLKQERSKKSTFGERKLECPECDRKFFIQQHLDNHMYVHRDYSEYPYQCEACGTAFIRESTLVSHREKCKGPDTDVPKPSHKCKLCGATFVSEKRWKTHTKAHGNEWECSLCKEKFLTKRGYLYHMSQCTPENAKYKVFRKPKKSPQIYTCPTCDRTFILKDRFEAHVASHDGIKRYQCSQCFTKFMSINNFKRHVCKFQLKVEIP